MSDSSLAKRCFFIGCAAGACLGLVACGATKHRGALRSEPSASVLASESLVMVGDNAFENLHVAVQLKRQADAVIASIDGRATHLEPIGPDARPSIAFAGDVNTAMTSQPRAGVPAGHSGWVIVRVLIRYDGGSRVSTSFAAHFKHGLALR